METSSRNFREKSESVRVTCIPYMGFEDTYLLSGQKMGRGRLLSVLRFNCNKFFGRFQENFRKCCGDSDARFYMKPLSSLKYNNNILSKITYVYWYFYKLHKSIRSNMQHNYGRRGIT